MKTMAEVLEEADAKWCSEVGCAASTDWARDMAAALSAAGFGPVQEAKAQALRDAADMLAKVGRDIDPWGKPTRENYADWLRSRADQLAAS